VSVRTKKPSRSTLRRITFLLLDVDGVMTDGGIYFSERGDEFKKFNIHDGYGIAKLRQAGVRVGLLTGRSSMLVERRAKELGIEEVRQNLENKVQAYEEIKSKYSLDDKEFAYVGDDEPDLPVMKRVGFAACPADAVASVRCQADFVSKFRGGEGAVREVVELILESRSRGV
jgi:3-deoxy-D-manno-octulosonate 8-phosphate phosphatase (KDO 8-P phosphatase)